jgi:DNA-binding IclR family transcriptional regulator
MHALEVIIVRNAEAAGRALGHAANDSDVVRCFDIEQAHAETPWELKAPNAFHEAYKKAREEG